MSMETFATWWAGLALFSKIYWAIAVPFTILFLLQMLLSFAGGEHPDDTPDADVASDHGIPFQFVTFKNMVGFFTVFAWTGIACIDAGFSVTLTLILSVLGGISMMILMAGTYYLISKAGADGTMRIVNAIGKEGEVYLTIPSRRGSAGKVQINVQGSLRTLDAMTDSDRDIPTGKLVKVSDIINQNMLLVTEK